MATKLHAGAFFKTPPTYAGLGVGGLAIATGRQPCDHRRTGCERRVPVFL